MKNDKWTKRNFHAIVEWMEKAEYIKPAQKEDRYIRVAHGIWRVQLEIHPSRLIGTSAASSSTSGKKTLEAKGDDATRLIQAYMEARFHRADYRPTKKDRDRAQSMLKQSPLDVLLRLMSRVIASVRAKKADDCYFGFAEPYFLKELNQQSSRSAQKKQHESESKEINHDLERLQIEQKAKQAQHQERLQLWRDASQEKKTDYVQAAINEASTPAAREMILNACFDKPAAVVLKQIELATSQPLPTTV